MEHVLQLLTRATGNQPDLLLALACRVQSVLSPDQHFWTCPLGPNPFGLCAGGNKLSSPLSSQSSLMSLVVVTATLIRLRSGFGSHFSPGEWLRRPVTPVSQDLAAVIWFCQGYGPGAAHLLASFPTRDVFSLSVQCC